MYVWIDDEEWFGAGMPPLSEEHGWLISHEPKETYGRVMSDDEERQIRKALLQLQLMTVPDPRG